MAKAKMQKKSFRSNMLLNCKDHCPREISTSSFHGITYRAFHGFGQAKFAYGGSVLGSSQFVLLPQLPLKMMLDLKVVKIDSKIIILLRSLILIRDIRTL